MQYNFKTQDFEGPLDVLLHLIKQSNMDIFNIKISDITDQYLNYIHQMKQQDLNITSEYLVMASELLELKSRELLPKKEDEFLEEEDPKERLINRLIEYQRYKEISSTFKLLEDERKKIYSKPPTYIEKFKNDTIKLEEDITLEDLVKAFESLNIKKEKDKPLNTVVTKKELSLHKRNTEIINKLKKYKKIKFEDLFDTYSKDYVVITFLSILDLAKKGNIVIKQNDVMGQITIHAKEVKS